MPKRPPAPEKRCPAKAWRGEPGHPMEKYTQCVHLIGHAGDLHRDENGNVFVIMPDGHAEVATIR